MKRTKQSTVHTSSRRFAFEMQQPVAPTTFFDRVVFLAGAAAMVWLAILFAIQGVRHMWSALLFIPVWLITAYFVLPRLHKLLSDLYVPDYFFGRTRTADGLLGDPVNLAVDGSFDQLDTVMREAGWHRADDITLVSTWKIIISTLTRRSYPTAPVSPLFLFGRRHDIAYEQEVEGNPKQRHHVRFWHCPPGWLLPGGAKVDWLGAATYDTNVGLSLFTLQVTHRIDENTDEERDYVVDGIRAADTAVKLQILRDFTTGYHARNGGGDRFITDGNLPIVNVDSVTVEKDAPVEEAPIVARAPLSVIAAAALIIISTVGDLARFFFDKEMQSMWTLGDPAALIVLGGVSLVWVLLLLSQVVMAWFVLKRGSRSRWVLIILLLIGIVSTALSYFGGEAVIGFNGTLFSASLMCLALVALSSESASSWTQRPKTRRLAKKKK